MNKHYFLLFPFLISVTAALQAQSLGQHQTILKADAVHANSQQAFRVISDRVEQSGAADMPVRRGFSIGPRLGLTFATEKLEPDAREGVDVRYRTGFVAGLVANYSVSNVFSLQPELLYIEKGVDVHLDVHETTPKGYYEIKGKNWLEKHYIELPVLAKLNFRIGSLGYFLTVGPSLGYWISGREYFNMREAVNDGNGTMTIIKKQNSKIEIEKEDKRLEPSANIGMGLGFGALCLDARYGIGLRRTNSEDEPEAAKNRVLSISLAYLFRAPVKGKEWP
ncbi:porin family protein [Pontibacter sp. CAU 1760]